MANNLQKSIERDLVQVNAPTKITALFIYKSWPHFPTTLSNIGRIVVSSAVIRMNACET
jgi:hypothetical protein